MTHTSPIETKVGRTGIWAKQDGDKYCYHIGGANWNDIDGKMNYMGYSGIRRKIRR